MSAGRTLSVVALTGPRARWSRRVADWSASGILDLRFHACKDVAQARAVGRAGAAPDADPSAVPAAIGSSADAGIDGSVDLLLMDAELSEAERHEARRCTQPTLGVVVSLDAEPPTGTSPSEHWLAADFEAEALCELLDLLRSRRAPSRLGADADADADGAHDPAQDTGSGARGAVSGTVSGAVSGAVASTVSGLLVAVCGRAGSGTSTTAVVLAQGLGERISQGAVCLADCSHYADQAMLHDTADLLPGWDELTAVASASAGRPSPSEVAATTHTVPARGYDLLLASRRLAAPDTALHAALRHTVEALTSAYAVTVVDCDDPAQLSSAGSDRGLGSEQLSEIGRGRRDGRDGREELLRVVLAAADAVVACGTAGMAGLRGLTLTVEALLAAGVRAQRVRPLVNRVGKPHHAAQAANATDRLLRRHGRIGPTAVMREASGLEQALQCGTRMPCAAMNAALAAVAGVDGFERLAAERGAMTRIAAAVGGRMAGPSRRRGASARLDSATERRARRAVAAMSSRGRGADR